MHYTNSPLFATTTNNHKNMVNQLVKSLSTAMNARVIGSGSQSVVLAHGYGGDQSVWEKVIPNLAQNYSVLVFDWPFSGAVKDQFDPVKYSSFDAFADDLISLLGEMKLRSSVFVGHSMSGMIGCIAAIKRPELFKRLILVGASPRYINLNDYEGGFEKSEIEQILSNIESNYENWATNFASLIVDPNDPLSVEKFQKCLKRMKPEASLPVAKIVFCSDERDTLEKVIIPCTIIQTTNDIAVPNSVADYMIKRISGKSTVEIIHANGHYPQLTAPLQLLEVLHRALGS